MTGRGPVPLWGAIVLWCFVMTLVLSIGAATIDVGNLGARALDEGVKGRFTATHTETVGSKSTRQQWVGTFVSDDGETTATDVSLTQNGRVTRNADKPVDRVAYLIDDPASDDPAVFADDYDSGKRMALGLVILGIGTVATTGVMIAYLVRRRRRRATLPA